MTPKRTAPPVARKLVDRPAAPPLPLLLVGDAVPEARLLLTEEILEDKEERAPEALEAREERLERTEETTEATSAAVNICDTKLRRDTTYNCCCRKGFAGEPELQPDPQRYSFAEDTL